MTTRTFNFNKNRSRVVHASNALKWYREGDPLDKSANVTDLLTDLRHYCDKHNLDFAHLDALAFSHYCEENGVQQNA